MGQPRPHRGALASNARAATLRAEVDAGRLAAKEVDVVLAAVAGGPSAQLEARRPADPKAGVTTRAVATLFAIEHDLLA